MSDPQKKPKKRHMRREPRPFMIDPEEIDFLLHILEEYADNHRLASSLKRQLTWLKDKFNDSYELVRELTIRAKANGFWSDTENTLQGCLREAKRQMNKHHRQTDEGIASLTPKQLKKMLIREEKQRRRDKEAAAKVATSDKKVKEKKAQSLNGEKMRGGL